MFVPTATVEQLKGDFVVLDLGSAHSRGWLEQVPCLAGAITLLEVDPLGEAAPPPGPFHRRIRIRSAVAGRAGRRPFKVRRFAEGSSFLDPDPTLLRQYGLEDYFRTQRVIEMNCISLGDLLRGQNLTRVDFLKTDLEGADFEVMESAPQLLEQVLCLQCELRFQPFFKGEKAFHEVVGFLDARGFELVGLKPEVWKYATPRRDWSRGGRVVWADAIFFLRPERLGPWGGEPWRIFAKQALIARLLGLTNYAEFLWQRHQALFPAAIGEELRALVRPPPSLGTALARAMIRLPGGWKLLSVSRRAFRRGYLATALFKDGVIGTIDMR